MKCLITGFEPFLRRSKNPSMEVLPLLEKELQDIDLRTLVLPVVFDHAFEQVKENIDAFKPDMILHLGLADNRDKISLERVAINIKDARASDNKDNKPVDEAIVKDGANAYFSSLPLREFEEALKNEEIPVVISNSAGTYVCNNVMYHTLHYIAKNSLPIKAGFIHLPLMQEQVENDDDGMPLAQIKKAIMLMVRSQR